MKIFNFSKYCFVAFTCLVSTLGSAESDQNSGITARGKCLKKIAQDRASVTLTSSALAMKSEESTSNATKQSQQLRKALLDLKLEDAQLNTNGYTVHDETEWTNKKSVFKGYRTRITLEIETSNIPRIGEAISAAAKLGIKDIGNLNTFVSAQKYKAEYENCLEEASRNARDKAAKLAKGANVSLGKVISIQEGSLERNSPSIQRTSYAVMGVRGMDDSTASVPSIDAKPLDLSVDVTITFQAN
jgi:uncharacterized protein YggE